MRTLIILALLAAPASGASAPGESGLLGFLESGLASTAGPGPGKTADAPPPAEEDGIDATKLLVSSGLVSSVIGGYLVYGYTKWWDDELEPFHYSDEGALQKDSYVGGVDKFGHLWGCLVLHRGISGLLQWSGVDPLPATLVGAGLVQALFLFAEIEDAFYDYGWSDADIVFNLLGSALGLALDLLPALDDLVDFRVWYRPTPYLNRRDFNVAEDYSGQKFFLVLKGGGVPFLEGTGLEYLELWAGYDAPGYRRYRERRERRVFFGLSLDLGRVIREFLFPVLRPPEVAEIASDFLFEHWQPYPVHAPVYQHTF